MADAAIDQEVQAKKTSKIPLVIGLIMALAGGGGGFFAVYSGMILGDGNGTEQTEDDLPSEPLPELAFVPIEPIIISLGAPADRQHLRFHAQLEVNPVYQREVERTLPRAIDVVNGYLRALSLSDLEDPAALMRIRSQLLHRIKVVAGEGRVNDLLIMEFVLN